LKFSNIQKKLYWTKFESRVHYCPVLTIFHEILLKVEKLNLFNVTWHDEFLENLWEVITNSYSKWPELIKPIGVCEWACEEKILFLAKFLKPHWENLYCRFTNQLHLGNDFLSEQIWSFWRQISQFGSWNSRSSIIENRV
jgi:hypothetical protein